MAVSMFKKLHELGIPTITLYVDGQAVIAERGETVAAVLLREKQHASRLSAVGGEPRAPFCMMGVCFDCLAIVDGISSTQTCLVPVQEGMRVERQFGRTKVTQ
jgi:predicted molibdopterin-dependent oxidoreductase YjgC